jgi:predicted NBD/HSP70 family sugar kinase
MHQAVNLNWRDVPLRTLLRKRYNLPVYVSNDCQVAALAEYTFGGKGSSTHDMVLIRVGWGVGAGIVLNGQLLHGNPLGAGEIGHVVVVDDGEQCACGNSGCLETVVSRRAILRRAQSASSSLRQFASDPERVTIDAVCQAFEAGDPAIEEIVYETGRSLGIAAANLVGVIGGCRILIAGSVEGFGQPLLDVIREEMSKRTLPSLARDTEVGFASLGSDIVLLGASALLLSHELGVL